MGGNSAYECLRHYLSVALENYLLESDLGQEDLTWVIYAIQGRLFSLS